MQTKLLDSNSTLAIMDPARANRASSVARYSCNHIIISERIQHYQKVIESELKASYILIF